MARQLGTSQKPCLARMIWKSISKGNRHPGAQDSWRRTAQRIDLVGIVRHWQWACQKYRSITLKQWMKKEVKILRNCVTHYQSMILKLKVKKMNRISKVLQLQSNIHQFWTNTIHLELKIKNPIDFSIIMINIQNSSLSCSTPMWSTAWVILEHLPTKTNLCVLQWSNTTKMALNILLRRKRMQKRLMKWWNKCK